MLKKLKIFFSVLLLLTTVAVSQNFLRPMTVYAADISWSYNSDTNTLTISGSGAIPDYQNASGKQAPWHEYYKVVQTIKIGNGITRIGDLSFKNFSALTSVQLPSSLKSIGENAFYTCTKLSSIDFPDSVTVIEAQAFYGCDALESPALPDSLQTLEERAFGSCDSITVFEIPYNCTTVGESVISGGDLDYVVVQNGNTNLASGFCANSTGIRIFGKKNSTAEDYCKSRKNPFFRLNADAPTNLKATGIDGGSIELTWTAAEYVSSYIVERYDDGELVFLGLTSECGGVDSWEIIPGQKQTYRITSFSETEDGWGYVGDWAEVSGVATIKAPTGVKAVSTGPEKIKISWNAMPDVDGYKIYRKSGDSWKSIKTISSASTTSYTNTGLTHGETYEYKVKGYRNVRGNTYVGSASSGVSAKTKVNVPTEIKATCTGPEKIKLSWKAASGVSGYKIYRKSGDSWKAIKTIDSATTTSYTNTGLTYNKTYEYMVRAYTKVNDKTYMSAKTSSVSAKTTIKAPSISSVKSSRSMATITWSKISTATGYYVYEKQGADGSYKKIATVNGQDKVSYTTPKRKANLQCYYKVKAYNGDYTSASSNEKSVKIVKKCVTCNGTGYCKVCGGDGKCSYCFGSGKEDCPDCCGSGDCFTCMGSGKDYDGSKCGTCGGKKTCRYCSGSGQTKCEACAKRGNGKCFNCEGSGHCVDCDGKGQ